MNWEKVFDIEYELYKECADYIEHGSEPKDMEKEACVKAFAAVQEYRQILEKKEKAPGEPTT